jgi:hypothetical protein
MESSAVGPEICRTCEAILRLQDRWTEVQRSGNGRGPSLKRLVGEARWFAMTLGKVPPCPAHEAAATRAREFAESVDDSGVAAVLEELRR